MPQRPKPTPGLPRLDVAVDSQPGFVASMLDSIGDHGELAGLSTRETDDPIIALFDAASTMLDVLAFYGELITNENFIRTAQERRSVLELAELIGYQPAPGVSASTLFALEVEPPPGVSPEVRIPAGLPAQKLPGDDGQVAVYESVDEIIARQDLNILRPAICRPAVPVFGDDTVVLDGIGLGVSPGDQLLLVGDERIADTTSERWDLRTIVDIEEIPNDNGLHSDLVPGRTEVTLDRPLGSLDPHVDPAAAAIRCFVLTQTSSLFGAGAPRWRDLPVSLRIGEVDPKPNSSSFITGSYAHEEHRWVDADLAAGTDTLWLDRVYKNVTAGSWVVVSRVGYSELYRVTNAQHGNHNAFMVSGPATRISLDGTQNIELFSIRTAVVLSGSKELALGQVPIEGPLSGSTITVHDAIEIAEGRVVVMTGTDAISGESVAEELVVASATANPQENTTTIDFTTSTRYAYDPRGCRIRANVVAANHGQTVRFQPIGSGDAGVAFLTLPLPTTPESPLTYTAAATPTGAESSLEIRVDGVAWNEVPTLAQAAPDAQVYVVRHLEGGGVEVQFGDGVTGARPGSGRDNITATWRGGIGLSGNARAEQITLLLGMPLGLQSVINPVAATGAEDPETLDTARVNAPTTIKALGRIVSLPDVEDFARTFAGIGWANAEALDDGDQPVVVLSVALADGSPLPAGSETAAALIDAVERVRVGDRRIVVLGHRDRPVEVDVLVEADPRYLADDVAQAVDAAIHLLFDHTHRLGQSRGFGQLLTPTKILGAVQDVDGVVAVVLRRLRAIDGAGPVITEVLARSARIEERSISPAEMLVASNVTVTIGAIG